MKKYKKCLYWNTDGCKGYNCCGVKDCVHTEKYQPWQNAVEVEECKDNG